MQDRVPVLGYVRFYARNYAPVSTHAPCKFMFCSCTEVGAAMAVSPWPAMPQDSEATVLGQVIL